MANGPESPFKRPETITSPFERVEEAAPPFEPVPGLGPVDPLELPAPTGFGEARKGLRAATLGLQAGARAGLSAISGLVGAEDAERRNMELAKRREAQAAKFPPRVGSLADVESAGDLGDFLSYGVPGLIPSMVLAAGGAVAGGVVGGVPGAVGGAVKGATLRAAAGAGLRAAGANLVRRAAPGALLGARVGAPAAIGLPEAGGVYSEILQETGEKRPIQSLVTGAGIGALEALALGKLLTRMAPSQAGSAFRQGLPTAIRDVSSVAASQALTEGTTEAAQEGLAILSTKMATGEPFTEEDFTRLIDAATIGAFAGMIMGGTGGATRYQMNKFKSKLDNWQHAVDIEEPFTAASEGPAAPTEIQDLLDPVAMQDVALSDVSELLKQIRTGEVDETGAEIAERMAPGRGAELISRLDVMYAQQEEQALGPEGVEEEIAAEERVEEEPIGFEDEEVFQESALGIDPSAAAFSMRDVAPVRAEHLLDNRGIPYAPPAPGIDRIQERIRSLNRTDSSYRGQVAELERERVAMEAAGPLTEEDRQEVARIEQQQRELLRDPPFRRVSLEEFLRREAALVTDGSPRAIRAHMLQRGEALHQRSQKFIPETTASLHDFMRTHEVIEKRTTADVIGREDLAGWNIDEVTPQYTPFEKEVRADLNRAKREATPDEIAQINEQLSSMERERDLRSILRRPPREGLREDEMKIKITDLAKLLTLKQEMNQAKAAGDQAAFDKAATAFNKEKQGREWHVALTNATFKGFSQLGERGFEEARAGVSGRRVQAAVFNALSSIYNMPGAKVEILQMPADNSLVFQTRGRRVTWGEVMSGSERQRATMAARAVQAQLEKARNVQAEYIRRAETAETAVDRTTFNNKARKLDETIEKMEDKVRDMLENARQATTTEDIEAWQTSAVAKELRGTELEGQRFEDLVEEAKGLEKESPQRVAITKLERTRARRRKESQKQVEIENQDRWEQVDQEGKDNAEVQWSQLEEPHVDNAGFFVGHDDPFRIRKSNRDEDSRQWREINRASNLYFTSRENRRLFQRLGESATPAEVRSQEAQHLEDLRARAGALTSKLSVLDAGLEILGPQIAETNQRRTRQVLIALQLRQRFPTRVTAEWRAFEREIANRPRVTQALHNVMQAARYLQTRNTAQLQEELAQLQREEGELPSSNLSRERVAVQVELDRLNEEIELISRLKTTPESAQESQFLLWMRSFDPEGDIAELRKTWTVEKAEADFYNAQRDAQENMRGALRRANWTTNRSKSHYYKQTWSGQFEAIRDGKKLAITGPATTATKSWRPGDTIVVQGANGERVKVEILGVESFYPEHFTGNRLADWKRNNQAERFPGGPGVEHIQAFISVVSDKTAFQKLNAEKTFSSRAAGLEKAEIRTGPSAVSSQRTKAGTALHEFAEAEITRTDFIADEQRIFNTWRKEIGMEDKAVLLNTEQMAEEFYSTGSYDGLVKLLTGSWNGVARSQVEYFRTDTGEVLSFQDAAVERALGVDVDFRETGVMFVWINPKLARRRLETTLIHELGHTIMWTSKDRWTPAQKTRILKEYNDFRQKNGKSFVERIGGASYGGDFKTSSPEAHDFMMDAMLQRRQAINGTDVGKFYFGGVDTEYLNDYEEFLADKVQQWAMNPKKPSKGSLERKAYKDWGTKIRKLFNLYKDETGEDSLNWSGVGDFMDMVMDTNQRGHWNSPIDVWEALASTMQRGSGLGANPAQWRRNEILNPRADELRVAIAKLGGINRQQALDEGFFEEIEVGLHEYGFGMQRIFTEDGLSFEEMGAKLREHGYRGNLKNNLRGSLEGVDVVSRHYTAESVYEAQRRETGFERPPSFAELDDLGFFDLTDEQQSFVEDEYTKAARRADWEERRPEDDGVTIEGKTEDDQRRASTSGAGSQGPAAESQNARTTEERPRTIPPEFLQRIRAYVERTTGLRLEQLLASKDSAMPGDSATARMVWLSMLSVDNAEGAIFNEAMRWGARSLFSNQERSFLLRFADRDHIRRRLMQLTGGDVRAQEAIRHDPLARLAYMYQFWNAGLLDLKAPKTQSLFQKVKDLLTGIFNLVAEDQKAEQLFTYFNDGLVKTRQHTQAGQFVVQRASWNENLDPWVRAAQQTWNSVGSAVNIVLATLTGRFKATKNPFILQILNEMYTPVGSQFVGEDMMTSRAKNRGRFNNMAYQIFKELSQEDGQRVLNVLNNPQTFNQIDDERIRTAVTKTWVLMREMRNYFEDAGLDIGDRGPQYFPWNFDIDGLMQRHDDFIALLNRPEYASVLQSIARQYDKTVEEAAQYIFESITQTGGLADVNLDPDAVTNIPGFGNINTRSLNWLDENATPEGRAILASFFSTDLGLTLSNYIDQGVKRAEYHKRFGDGRLEALYSNAREFGATENDMATLRAGMDAMMGTAGYQTNRWLHRVLNLTPPRPGQPIDPRLQRLQGAMMVYQNLRTLGLATLTSLADVGGLWVRTGDLNMAFNAFKIGMKEAVTAARGNQSVLTDLGEMLGIIDRQMTVEALNWEYGGVYITGRARKLNEAFFRYIGLQWWTKTTRLMALEGGLRFVKRHVQSPNEHSERFLAELNLRREDVRFTEDGEVLILSEAQRAELRQRVLDGLEGAREELDRDDRVRSGLHRFVDGAILRPNAAQRPIWASDPHFMLIFHLKSFIFSFHERILMRVAHEVRNQESFWPIIQLGGYIPIMIGADMLRELITEPLEFDDEKKEWGTGDWVKHAGRRAGLLGKYELALDAKEDFKYGHPFSSALGPTYETFFRHVPGAFQGDDRSVVKLLPGQNIITPWVY